MGTRVRRTLSLLLVVGLVGWMTPGVSVAAQRAPDILTRLRAVPGLKVVAELPAGPAGYRAFQLTFRQPIDHRHPDKGSFDQRVTLMDTGADKPTVLYTTGFMLLEPPVLAEPTQLVGGNQISVEERFFGASTPQPADWSKDTIWQAATDHHVLAQAFKHVYRGPWISTGAPGKGGMTTVYHRRFYPRDVDGSVVYSAANDVDNTQNQAYDKFLTTVGPKECREAIQALQRQALIRRDELVPRYAAYAKKMGLTFTTMGTPDHAWEGQVRDTIWGFFQNDKLSDCAKVPPADASTDAIWDFFLNLTDMTWYTDAFLGAYMPYYYQAMAQLGWPQPAFSYLADLRKYPNDYTPKDFVPAGIQPRRFDTAAMADIDHWVRTAGSRLIFLYGENDPYSVKPFRFGSGTRDSLWYKAAGVGTSGQTVQALPESQRLRVIASLRRWTGSSVRS